MAVLDAVVPHAHARFAEHGDLPAERRRARERGTLLLSALTIHNLPEGMAVGVAFAALTGWVEPPAAALALLAFETVEPLLAGGLAFAGGAMLYVIVDARQRVRLALAA